MNIREFAESLFICNPTRYEEEEKNKFLAGCRSFLTDNGWKSSEVSVQRFKGKPRTQNLIIGDPKTAEYIITAHYDTPGRNGFMLGSSKLIGQTGANIVMMLCCLPVCAIGFFAGQLMHDDSVSMARFLLVLAAFLLILIGFMVFMFVPMFIKNPSNRNDNTSGVIAVLDAAVRAAVDPELKGKCCFVLFDNEEWGLIGSIKFAKWSRNTGINLDDKTCINIDCVGIGEKLYAARTNSKQTERQSDIISRLCAAGLEITEKQSSMVFMSDHASLKNSFMLTYMDRSKIGAPYIPNIHTSKDTVCDVDKVLDLSERIIKAIKG